MASVLELKELTTPGTELGPHTTTYDGDDRFDVLKPYWWSTAALGDHFTVHVLGGRFVVRDRYTRTNPKPAKLTAPQLHNMIQSEAALLGAKHKAAWASIDPTALRAWLAASAAALTARWTAAYTADGGT